MSKNLEQNMNDGNVKVSIIVPTKNSSSTLEDCLRSIKTQTYKNIEVIVVDNFSTDNTPDIAKKYADKFFQVGPERSAQRNFGVKNSTGKYVAIIDSDMELSESVTIECLNEMQKKNVVAVVIPEESFGTTFWANVKKLERSYYVGINFMEAARFYEKAIYEKLGGYDEGLIR